MIDQDEWYWSASRLKLMGECLHKFFRQYIVKDLPKEFSPFAAMGTGVHEVNEVYRQKPNLSMNERVEIYNNSLKREYGDKPVDSFIQKAGTQIIFSTRNDLIFRGDLVAVEEEFDIVKDGIRLYGFIDKIESDKGVLYIDDYKTNQAIEPKIYIPQLVIYDIAGEVKYPEFKERVESLIYLRYNKRIEYKVSEQQRTKMIADLKNIQSFVFDNQGDISKFPKLKRKTKSCSFCPLKKECWK